MAKQPDKNFWFEMKKPILALAPMAGVTDSAFRRICKAYGADVVYSEMISAAALAYGSEKTLALMAFNKIERPYVVQLFGSKPEHFALAASMAEKKIRPDGLDINFGCPVKKVAKQGAGAALMDNLKLVREIIAATIENTGLPVSIKIRSRVGRTDALKFLRAVADLDIKAVMIHGRSLVQGHGGPVDWQIIKKARPYVRGILLANGGVKDSDSARELLEKTRADGLGIGQGALGQPWIFKQLLTESYKPATGQIFAVILKHAKLAEKLKGRAGIAELRKHLCWYVRGMANAARLRSEFIKAESLKEIQAILKNR